MPLRPPSLSMPASHRVWDEYGALVPEMFRDLSARRMLDQMPALPAGADELPDEYLLRAATLLGILAHAYHHLFPDRPAPLPRSVSEPWAVVSRRLERPAPHLGFIDLMTNNWRYRDPNGPMRVGNLDLLVPSVGTEEERIFLLTFVEVSAQATPAIIASVRAQDAAVRDDPGALAEALMAMTASLQEIAFESFNRIDPNPLSATYVDPVIWAKTVAPFAVPLQEDKSGVAGPSGTAAPIFHLFDVFFGRAYKSRFGEEMRHIRSWYPRHWRDFITAFEQTSVPDYVARSGNRELIGLFKEAVHSYVGEAGFLTRHRLKVYGYLDIAFKVGRSVTITGFSGQFADRTWDSVDDELAAAVSERHEAAPSDIHHADIARVETLNPEADGDVRQVVLDVAGNGVRYRPGDRIALSPENSAELVEHTLRSLRAAGDETIALTAAWRHAPVVRDRHPEAKSLPLRTILTLGQIRPVPRDSAKILHALALNEALARIIESRAEDQWELWDLLDLLARGGFDPATLWRAHPGEQIHICRVVPPELHRMYSISSSMDGSPRGAEELHLTIGHLRYRTKDSPVSREAERLGTASSFLGVQETAGTRVVSFGVVRPARFALPEDPGTPVVMFAGGTGIAPFRGFWQERFSREGAGETWLFFATRTRHRLYYENELRDAAAAGLRLRVAFSGDPVQLRTETEQDPPSFVLEPGEARSIDAEMLEEENASALWDLLRARDKGGKSAVFYVCGRTGFAGAILRTLKEIAHRCGSEREAAEILPRLAAEGRLQQDIFTTYGGPVAELPAYRISDLILHNEEEAGYRMVIDGRVYDLTEYIHLHPGGRKVLAGYAGLDATHAYRKVRHHVNPEVDSVRGIYQIGVVQRIDFGTEWGTAIGSKGLRFVPLAEVYRAWVRFAYAIVEMENAVKNDFTIVERPLTMVDTPGENSGFLLRLLLEAHQRFSANYLAYSVGEALEDLWSVTAGLYSSSLSAQWMRTAIAEVQDSPQARRAGDVSRNAEEHLLSSRIGEEDPGSLDHVAEVSRALEAADRAYLRDIKLAIREALMLFEDLGAEAGRNASDQPVAVLRRVPDILDRYYGEMAALDTKLPAPLGSE